MSGSANDKSEANTMSERTTFQEQYIQFHAQNSLANYLLLRRQSLLEIRRACAYVPALALRERAALEGRRAEERPEIESSNN
jgi:hypothetical protein